MLAPSKASTPSAMRAMMRVDASRYACRLSRTNTASGSPRRRAASARRQAREIGSAERMPYFRAA